MASEPISGLNSASLPLDPDTLFAAVPPSNIGIETNKTTLSAMIQSVFANIQYSVVGTGAIYQYQTIHDAYTDGKDKLWVVTDITETVSTVFTGNLTVKFNNNVNVNFNDGITFSWAAGSASIIFAVEGVCFLNYNHTSPCTVIDLTLVSNLTPAQFTGVFVFNNQSAPSVAVKPLATDPVALYTVTMERIVYLSTGVNSYFDLGFAQIEEFVLVTNGVDDAFGIKISSNGHIGTLILGSECSSNTTWCDVTNATIDLASSYSSTGVPFITLVNSSLLSALGINAAIKINASALNSGQKTFVQNARNIIPLPAGAYASDFDTCLIAGINTSALTGGTNTYANCTWSGFFDLDNTDAYMNFNFCKFKQGFAITNSPGTQLTGCDFGEPGQSYGLTLNAGAINTTVMGGRTNVAIVDNGTGTQIIPSPQLF